MPDLSAIGMLAPFLTTGGGYPDPWQFTGAAPTNQGFPGDTPNPGTPVDWLAKLAAQRAQQNPGMAAPASPDAPFGAAPVMLPGMLSDLIQQPAPQSPSGSGLPSYAADILAPPVAPQAAASAPSVPLPRPRPASAPTGDDQLPENATATVGTGVPFGLAPTAPTATPADAEPSFGQRVKSKLEDIAGRLDPEERTRQVQNLTVQTLQRKGLSRDDAIVAAANPQILQQLLGQMYGPKVAPQIHEIPTESGKRSVFWDPQRGQYIDVLTRQPITDRPPMGPSSSPFAAASPPPGVDPDAWRKAEATRIAQEGSTLREKGEGAVEFLPDALRVLDKMKTRGQPVIGPVAGSDWWNNVRAAGSVLGLDEPKRNLSTFNELQSDLKRLSASNLKAQFGARPTNIDVQLNQSTFGGLQSADADTAARILNERVRGSYDVLGRNIEAGMIDPRKVPPDVLQRGVSMGYLNPALFGGQPSGQPSPTSAAAMPSELRGASQQDQMNAAPDGTIMRMGDNRLIKRNGKWGALSQ